VKRRSRWWRIRKRRKWGVVIDTIALKLTESYTAVEVPVRPFGKDTLQTSRSQCPRDLWRRSAAARLLRLWVRISPGAWMSVCSECCVLSGRGLCDELITRP
jgi:hypothetical protein